jgi:cytochrome c oxidase accessory protein FixG
MNEVVQVEDALSRRAQKESPLYADRVRVYPKRVLGTFRRIKWAALGVMLAIYYVMPWVRWDRGPGVPDQAVLIDMENRRAYFFGIEIWPQEVYYLTGLLILAAIGLFLMTSLAGRVWCGYACPQTVWTDIYMMVERWIEGDRNARIKLDQGPTTANKIARKIAKHGTWLLIALVTGGAWILYFDDAPSMLTALVTGQASSTSYFFVGLFTATTYLLAGWAREQVCTYMCPWPRIQAAMFDEDSLVVTYQKWRGEPRGRHHKGESWEGRGHCVDCNQCVAVCPTGIDIRDGNQLECIGCALCIDACAGVMEKVGLPKGLITYDTERNQALRAAGKPPHYRLIRPRTILYALLFAGVGLIMLVTLGTRTTLSINVLPDRAPLFVTLSDGSIRNGYIVKILNKSRELRTFAFAIEGLPQATLHVIGQGEEVTKARLSSRSDQVATYKVYVRVPRGTLHGDSASFRFVLTDERTGEKAVNETIFRGPER